MQQEAWVSWLVRLVFSAMAIGTVLAFFRWLKGNRGTWGQLWEALNTSLKRQVISVASVATACLLATILWPLARLDELGAQTITTILGLVWIAVAAWGASLVFSIVVSTIKWKHKVDVADNHRARKVHTRLRILQRVVSVLIWIAAAAGMLMQFDSFRTLGTTLLASAGVLSIVLGISAQKTFGSMIAGIQLALSQPISLDDVVIVEGEWGRIEEITFTYVVVRIWDQRRLIVPVSYFLETPFQNWTKKSADITGSVFLYLDYSTPLQPLREEARRLCESTRELWDGETCVVQVTDSGPETMTVRVLAGSPDASKAWELRCLVREGLIRFVNDNYPGSLPKRRLVLDGQQETESMQAPAE